jgi:hypothetical protein
MVKMLSTLEASTKWGITQDHVKWLATHGRIKAQKIGRDWVILEQDYQRKRKPKRKGNKWLI